MTESHQVTLHITLGHMKVQERSTQTSVMICLGQTFWHQETVAVIDGQLWELERHLWEGVILIGRHGNVCVMDTYEPTTDGHLTHDIR